MQMPNGGAIQRNRNHINYTHPPFTIPMPFCAEKEAIFDFICWHTTLRNEQTQRSVLAHFISCCPIPMGRVVNAAEEEVKWTEGKKKLLGGWQPYIQQVASNPWPVITSSLSLAPLHTVCAQLNEICFYIFSINSVAPSRTTTG